VPDNVPLVPVTVTSYVAWVVLFFVVKTSIVVDWAPEVSLTVVDVSDTMGGWFTFGENVVESVTDPEKPLTLVKTIVAFPVSPFAKRISGRSVAIVNVGVGRRVNVVP
jgi:hypothetical protein